MKSKGNETKTGISRQTTDYVYVRKTVGSSSHWTII